MANKTTIKINLSKSSVDKALEDVRKYRQGFDQKLEELMDRLGAVGIKTIHAIMDRIPEDDEPGNYSTSYHTEGGKTTYKTTIRLTGDRVLFIEFSAGVTYGTQYYPTKAGAEFGAGTYPDGKGHWADPKGWWYEDPNSPKGYTHTKGNRAYMPVYHSSEAIVLQVQQIAREVFS